MTWHSSWAFILLPVLLVVLSWIWWQRKQRRATVLVGSLDMIKVSGKTLRSRLVWLPILLKTLALILAIVAMARPQKADTHVSRSVEGIDIMVVMDISDSMLIEDMEPENRLEASKVIIRDFIKGRSHDRIGLIVFAGESFTRVPLTLDYPLLLQSLEDVEITRSIKMGTAIGVALANAVARLKESTVKNRVILFMTDGENNSGTIDPETALEIAKGYGLKIYAIGVGRDGQAQLPVYLEDARGNRVKRYRPIYSQINEDLLRRMADETGGRFYRAITADALNRVFQEIDRLETSEIEVNEYTRYAELFPPYLRWAMICYLLALFLGRTWLRRGP